MRQGLDVRVFNIFTIYMTLDEEWIIFQIVYELSQYWSIVELMKK
jgi:hypothetical protein